MFNLVNFRLNEMENEYQEANGLDYKITKKHYPRTHTENCLEFVFDRDPNLFLRKDKILIRGAIEVHKDYVVENGFASKLFSLMTVEVDSQTISQSNNRYEFIRFIKIHQYLGVNISSAITFTRWRIIIATQSSQWVTLKVILILTIQIIPR